MARIRSVHPGLFTDEAFAGCSSAAQVLFIGIWTEADDCGAFEWKPITLKMRLMPVHNVDIAALMEELEAADMVRQYSHNGKKYGLVRNFCRFQRPKKPKSVHFIPPEFRAYVASGSASTERNDDEEGSGTESEASEATRVPPKSELAAHENASVPPSSEKSPQMEDVIGGGSSRKKESSTSGKSTLVGEPTGAPELRLVPTQPAKPDPAAGFDRFWQAYPGRGEASNPKKPARERFAALVAKGDDPEAIIAGVQRYAAALSRAGKIGTETVAQAVTFLNQRRWEDYPAVPEPSPLAPPGSPDNPMGKRPRLIAGSPEWKAAYEG